MPEPAVRSVAKPPSESPAFSDEALFLTDASAATRAIADWSLLEPLHEAWQELARVAAEPNPFYEPWMLLPALRAFAPAGQIEVIAVFRGELLCGLFPP